MYRARYRFNDQNSRTLNFEEGVLLTELKAVDQHWIFAQDQSGAKGLAPLNYLNKLNKESEQDVVSSIDHAIEVVHAQSAELAGEAKSASERKLALLWEHRKRVVSKFNVSHDVESSPLQRLPSTGTPKSAAHLKTAASLQPETATSPQSGTATPPQRGTATPPQSGTATPPQRETATPPQRETATPPQRETATQPQQRTATSPQRETATSPQRGTATSPQRGTATSPQRGTATSPQRGTATSPQRGTATSPKRGTATPLQRETATPPQRAQVNASHKGEVMPTSLQLPGIVPARQEGISTDMKNMAPIPTTIGVDMMELVRERTNLSFEKSWTAVNVILTHLKENVPQVESAMEEVLLTLQNFKREDSKLEESPDAVQLREIFNNLMSCQEDTQQRSWALHEDMTMISSNLQQLIQIVNDADPCVSRMVIHRDKYCAIHSLVLYYQVEERSSLRLLLLQAFASLCELDQQVISELLNSVLALELAQDMVQNCSDVTNLNYSGLVLAMIFSTGELIPVGHYRHLNATFINFLLDTIESDREDSVTATCMRLLLSFNLHFILPTENTIMKQLAVRNSTKVFTEKLLLYTNRGADPVQLFEDKLNTPNSTLKLLADMFSTPDTSNLFYTNDARVLIDILLRQICDFSPGEQLRTESLSVVQLLIANSNYSEHLHRRAELQVCFVRILGEEGESSFLDQQIIERIFECHGELFVIK